MDNNALNTARPHLLANSMVQHEQAIKNGLTIKQVCLYMQCSLCVIFYFLPHAQRCLSRAQRHRLWLHSQNDFIAPFYVRMGYSIRHGEHH